MIFVVIATFIITSLIYQRHLNRFYNRIKHGDEEHQNWLKKEFEHYWDMKIKDD